MQQRRDEEQALLYRLPVVKTPMQFAINEGGPSFDLVPSCRIGRRAIEIGSDVPDELLIPKELVEMG
ncbi:hypothetical protein [Zoogloea sp.]|uniref:hypothetical protein n=1 Tax=Zoogloea sp. TaxID=49181 RepID=UPI0026104667|nr:hypothetical protein [Zoogloea sp.]